MSRIRVAAAPAALLGMFALVACTGAPGGPTLPNPTELDVTAPLMEGFSGGAGAVIDPRADPPAEISFDLEAGTYLLQVACTSVDGSAATVTVGLGNAADTFTHHAGCGAADASGFVAAVTESEPFDVPGGEVTVIGTAAVSASFNTSFISTGA